MHPISVHFPLAFDNNRTARNHLAPWGLQLQELGAVGRTMHAARLGRRFHSRRNVDSIAEKAVPQVASAHDTGHDGARVKARADADIALAQVALVYGRLVGRLNGSPRKIRDALSVIGLVLDEVRNRHVRVSDGLDLKHPKLLGEQVKLRVQTVEHERDFLRLQRRRNVREADDVREEYRDDIPFFRLDLLATAEGVGHMLRKHIVQQLEGAPLL
mmetsp:Transcript_37604/g.103266  ORF Transcript_37604/g.103266 Transcript_37604/m.103266 type:complete len:215 (-) Transcript_37604:1126-1770(-)